MIAEPEFPSPRRFTALAMPRPDDPAGHAVLLVETCDGERKELVLSRAEAEQVRAALDAALMAFFVGEKLSEVLDLDHAARTLVHAAAEAFGWHPDVLIGSGRGAGLVRARNAACWVLRERLGMGSPATGRLLGGRDHTTVLHALNNAERDRDRDPAYRAALDQLLRTPLPHSAPRHASELEPDPMGMPA